MEDLARIRTRIESLAELGELVRALRSMAAARSREAQEALAGTRAYGTVVERAIAAVADIPDGAVEATALRGRGAPVLLMIASENGFVGGYNTRIAARALSVREPGETLVAVGRRGILALSERGVVPDIGLPMTSRVGGVTALSRRIASGLPDPASLRIVFARHARGAAFDIEVRTVPSRDEEAEPSDRPPPVIHLPLASLLAELSDELVFAEIAHALMEGLASENGARLLAMDQATRNISDRLDKLERDQRNARQEETTTDMLDVVIGAEAVSQSQERSRPT